MPKYKVKGTIVWYDPRTEEFETIVNALNEDNAEDVALDDAPNGEYEVSWLENPLVEEIVEE